MWIRFMLWDRGWQPFSVMGQITRNLGSADGRVGLLTPQFCPCDVNEGRWCIIEPGGLGSSQCECRECVNERVGLCSIKLYSWTLICEFHISFKCHEMLYLIFFFKPTFACGLYRLRQWVVAGWSLLDSGRSYFATWEKNSFVFGINSYQNLVR